MTLRMFLVSRDIKARPLCAVCGHPVDRMTETYDLDRPRIRFVAYCHGETEVVTIEEEETQGRVDPSLGTAFANSTRRLAP